MSYFNYSFLRPDYDPEEGLRETFNSPYRKILEQPPLEIQPATNAPARPSIGSLYEGLQNLPMDPAMQSYLEHVRNAPKREDFKPNKLTRLAAALSGASEGWFRGAGAGFQTSQGMIESPYRRAMSDWEDKGKSLGTAANIVRQSMDDRIQMLKNIQASELAQKNFDLQYQNIQSQINSRALTNQKAQKELEKLELEMKNYGWDAITNEQTGERVLVNKYTGAQRVIGKFAESIPEKETRERARFSFEEGQRQSGRKELQEDAQVHARETQATAANNAKALETYRQTNRLARDASGNKVNTNLLNQNRKAAASLISTHPKSFKQVDIEIDGDDIKMGNPPDMTKNPSGYAKYVAVHNRLYNNIPGAILLSPPSGFDADGKPLPGHDNNGKPVGINLDTPN